MSTGMELIPLALAVGAAARGAATLARRLDGPEPEASLPEVRQVGTRFRDESLLLEALGAGAVKRDGTLHGVVGGHAIALAPDANGTYSAYFHGDVPAGPAEAAVRTLDAAYGRLVQRDVRRRVLEQAPNHGLALERERVEADGSIVLTLRVGG